MENEKEADTKKKRGGRKTYAPPSAAAAGVGSRRAPKAKAAPVPAKGSKTPLKDTPKCCECGAFAQHIY